MSVCVFTPNKHCHFSSENAHHPSKTGTFNAFFQGKVTCRMSSSRLLQKIIEIFDSVDFLQQQHQQQKKHQQTLEIIGNFASVAEVLEDFARTPSSEQSFLMCCLLFQFHVFALFFKLGSPRGCFVLIFLHAPLWCFRLHRASQRLFNPPSTVFGGRFSRSP